MNSLILASFLAVATALPIEDTPGVVAAKAEFSAAFAVAEKGEHAALAPVNTDVQAPAPVHVIPEPAALAAALPYAVLPSAGLPYAGLPAAGLSYAGHPAAG